MFLVALFNFFEFLNKASLFRRVEVFEKGKHRIFRK